MLVWRLALGRYKELDGEGARLYGGRWNSPGTAMVYAATHIALALLEQLVHVSPTRLPGSFRVFAITLPEETEHAAPDLPVDDLEATRRAGDDWASSLRSAALVVPSVIVPAASGSRWDRHDGAQRAAESTAPLGSDLAGGRDLFPGGPEAASRRQPGIGIEQAGAATRLRQQQGLRRKPCQKVPGGAKTVPPAAPVAQGACS